MLRTYLESHCGRLGRLFYNNGHIVNQRFQMFHLDIHFARHLVNFEPSPALAKGQGRRDSCPGS